jgi:Leucine-rich repeat (LRR) protein/MoxR-like ATPase
MTNFSMRREGLEEAKWRIGVCYNDEATTLDLSDLGLEQVPGELEILQERLISLDLNYNKIKKLPDFICGFRFLQTLDISRNRLRALPENIGNLNFLRALNLRDNELTDLPESIGNIHFLQRLDVSRNKLSSLPVGLKNCFVLNDFDISRNRIDGLPEIIENIAGRAQLTLIDHIGAIVSSVREHVLDDDYFDLEHSHVSAVANFFNVTPVQAVLYSVMLSHFDDRCITFYEIADALNKTRLEMLPWLRELAELEKAHLIMANRNGNITYSIPSDIIEAVRTETPYKFEVPKNITEREFYEYIGGLFQRYDDSDGLLEVLLDDALLLMSNNTHLDAAKKILSLKLDSIGLAVLLFQIFMFSCNDIDCVEYWQLDHFLSDRKLLKALDGMLANDHHPLFAQGVIEKKDDDDAEYDVRLFFGEKAKKEFFTGIMSRRAKKDDDKNIIRAASIKRRDLFFDSATEKNISRLRSLLHNDKYKLVQNALAAHNFHTGFACLFSGESGTGKTETVLQLARETGRDIINVNIAKMRSAYVGENENLMKNLFDEYRAAVQNAHDERRPEPILFFNEADALLSKRLNLDDVNAVITKMENTVQNIILAEMEKLEGILIATTNLTTNMDKAFERRFLFKIEFSNPGLNARKAIWQSMLPSISEKTICELAALFELSGAQIENIARKYIVETIIEDGKNSLQNLISFCKEEVPEDRRFLA